MFKKTMCNNHLKTRHLSRSANPWYIIGLLIIAASLSGCSLLTRGDHNPQLLVDIRTSEAATRRLFDRYQQRLPAKTIDSETQQLRYRLQDMLAQFELADQAQDITAKQLRRLLRIFNRSASTRTDQRHKPWTATEATRFKKQLSLAYRQLYRSEQSKR